MRSEIMENGEDRYPVFFEFEKSMLPFEFMQPLLGLMNFFMYGSLLFLPNYSFIYYLSQLIGKQRYHLFQFLIGLSYLQGYLEITMVTFRMLQYSMQYFSALYMNALYLHLIYPYTLFEALNTWNDDYYSIEFMEDPEAFKKQEWPLNYKQGISYHYLIGTLEFDQEIRTSRYVILLAIIN